MLKKVSQFFSKSSVKKYLLIILGGVSWYLVMVRSGLCWDKGCAGGVGFWGANGHDGVWHLALIKSLAGGNFQMPTFAGWDIQNYHIGFDLLMSWVVRLTGVSVSVLYFQIVPALLATFIGILTYKFVKDWRHSETSAWWATFFVYFGGSWGWLVSLLRGQGLGGESMFWSQQSISTLINPPFAFSIVTILLGLIFLQKFLIKKTWISFLLMSFFFGISIFVKVYAGLLVLTCLLVVSIWRIIRKKDFTLLAGFLLSLLISVFLFISFNKTSVGLISFNPFWFLESMMSLSDRFNWPKMYSAMTTYRMGHIWVKGVLAYLVAFMIFIIGNFGTRIIAFKNVFRNAKKLLLDDIMVFLLVLILAGITVPMFFVQEGTPWNTIQFFYYSLIFSGMIAGITVARTSMIRIMAVLVILLTVPTTIASLRNYLPQKPQSVLPMAEKEALEFLSKEPSGIVLTYPFDKQASSKAIAPRALYLYDSTAYVSAFSGKTTFLEEEVNLGLMQYPWQERKKTVLDFLNTLDIDDARRFLKENNITYIYWLKGQHARIGDSQLGLTKIFENSVVTIFKVN